MAGVGIDLLELERLAQALAGEPELAARLFTGRERADVAGRLRPGMHLAACFCAKEAVVKALALEFWDPHDIEVVRGEDDAPTVHLSGHAQARARKLGATVRSRSATPAASRPRSRSPGSEVRVANVEATGRACVRARRPVILLMRVHPVPTSTFG